MSYWNDRRGRRFCADVLRAVDPSYRVVWRLTQPKRTSGWRRTPTWPGDGRLVMSERDLVRALHDLAHAMIAPAERRRLPEFGLGPDPANMQDHTPRVVSMRAAKAEESLACELHWCLAAYLEGVDGVRDVEGYVDMDVPLTRMINDLGRRFARVLPPDFTRVVLAVRQDRLLPVDHA